MAKKTLTFTTTQVTQILADLKASGRENSDLFRLLMEAMMRAEREEFKASTGDVGNGYRPRRAMYDGRVMQLQVPRTRTGNFYPVLLGILKDQRAEMERLTYSLYTKGLTTEQIGDMFGDLYGHAYSKQSVSRMATLAREEVLGWLERPLDTYYPILYIDCTFVPVRRGGSVCKEAFDTILGVRSDLTRKALTDELGRVIHQITESDTPETVHARFRTLGEQWGKKYAKIARMAEDIRYVYYFTYVSYHPDVRPMIRSTNWIERLNRDYKRTLRMRGALPNVDAVLFLLGSVAIQKTSYHRKIPRIDAKNHLLSWQPRSAQPSF